MENPFRIFSPEKSQSKTILKILKNGSGYEHVSIMEPFFKPGDTGKRKQGTGKRCQLKKQREK